MFRSILVALALVFSCLAASAQPAPQDAVSTDGAMALPVTEREFVTAPAATKVEAAPEAGSDFSAVVGTIKDTIIAILTAVLTGALGWLTTRVAAWTGGKIRLDEVLRDNQMEQYAKGAVEKAFAFALARAGVNWDQLQNVQIKSQVLRYATDFLLSQYPEVVKWVDKDQNGVIDWVETMLPSWAILPVPQAAVPTTAPLGFADMASAPVAKAGPRRAAKRAGIKPAKSKPGLLDIPPLTSDTTGQTA